MLTMLRTVSLLSLALIVSVALADDPPLAGGHPQDAEKQPDKPSAEQKADKKKERTPAKKQATAQQADKNKEGDTDKKAKQEAEKQQAAKKKADKPSDAQREEAAFVLVREFHPDLVELLKRLKTTKPKEYQQAVRELYRDSQRLEVSRERDPERFRLELRAWQLDSRIRLLTAKLSLEDRPELQEDLRTALAERADVRLAQKRLDRDRAAARLKKIDEEISSLTTGRDDDLKRTFDRLLRGAEKARPAKDKAAGDRRQASGDKKVAPAPGASNSPPLTPNP